MLTQKTYRAVADLERAEAIAATTSPFTIEVRFLSGLTPRQEDAFARAADRWSRIIVGDLPTVVFDGEVIDDVSILAQGVPIDGEGRVLGQAGPTHLRPATAGRAALLPVRGIMSFDTADLAKMESEGTLNDVITHEMGHVLGVGTLTRRKRLIRGAGTANPVFTGEGAMREYAALRGNAHPIPVPLENTGGRGTAEAHWRETIFHAEMMSGIIRGPGNPLSRLTAACLADLGYQVDLEAAEEYQLPDFLELAEAGEMVPHTAPIDVGEMLPVIPIELPAAA
jgi:Leishmanolysin